MTDDTRVLLAALGAQLLGFVLVLLLLLVVGCSVQVTMTHQLRAPIRCLAIRNLGIMGVRCEHEPPAEDVNPPPGSEVPPL